MGSSWGLRSRGILARIEKGDRPRALAADFYDCFASRPLEVGHSRLNGELASGGENSHIAVRLAADEALKAMQ